MPDSLNIRYELAPVEGDPILLETELAEGLEIKNYPHGYLKYKICDDYVEMRSILVLPKLREKGLGTKMMKDLEKIAKKLNKKTLYIHLSEDNKMMHQAATKWGYTRIEGWLNWIKKINGYRQ